MRNRAQIRYSQLWHCLSVSQACSIAHLCDRPVNMSTETTYPQPPYPLHDSVKNLVDPEYAAFYNQYLLNAPQVHYQPVAASRVGGRIIPVSCLSAYANSG